MILGIDFGTCFSSVAVMDGGKAVTQGVLLDDVANTGIPTLFAIENGKMVFGEECKYLLGNATIIKNLKLKMRQQSADGKNPLDVFEITDAKDARSGMKRRDILKEYVSYLLGEALKGIKIKGTVDKINRLESVAVTIPVGLDKNATFKSDYTRAVKDAVVEAGKRHGLTPENVMVVEEPVAAAMSYLESYEGRVNERNSKQSVLVLDIGGGTADVAIVECDRDAHSYVPVYTKGDLHLGGNDWDEALKKFILKKFNAENDSHLKNEELLNKLDSDINDLKHSLTKRPEGNISMPWIYNLKKITRNEFEEETKGLLKRVQDLVTISVQAYSGKISNIVLVGGACNMPQIKRGLESMSLIKGINIRLFNPSKAIAEGAAFYASCGHVTGSNSNCEAVPVAMATYGLDYTDRETRKPMVENVIFKGQRFGAQGYLEGKSQNYVATDKNTVTITSKIYESECRNVNGEIKVLADGTSDKKLRINGKIIRLTVPSQFIGKADQYHHYYVLKLYADGDLKIEIYEQSSVGSTNYVKVNSSRIKEEYGD